MGYQALLFCPDEKTARTVTQVLSELEFSVVACTEPFAAVKKLMGERFDAIVVDCDSEQNATLLFKSARNSTSNQAALAVAVVEGQAGVAKAFRIGANLVLTKPINVEQAKGTLRVARGLLRKGEPAKASLPGGVSPEPAKAMPVTPAPPTKAATSTSESGKAEWPHPDTLSQPAKPSASPVAATSVAPAKTASPVLSANDEDDVIDIDEPATPPTAARIPAVSSFLLKPAMPVSKPGMPSVAAASSAEIKSAKDTIPPSHMALMSSASGAVTGSAAAPARSLQTFGAEKGTPPDVVGPAEALFDKPADSGKVESSAQLAEPSFSFGGVNAAEEPSAGGSKKIFVGLAATALVAAGLYLGWAHFHGKTSSAEEESPNPSATAPANTMTPAASPVVPKDRPATSKAGVEQISTPSSSPSQNATRSTPQKLTEKPAADSNQHSSDKTAAKGSGKTPGPISASPAKPSADEEPAPQPIVVKKGTAVSVHTAAPSSDTAAAPSVVGIEASTSGGSLSNLLDNPNAASKPVLQTLNVSQGVSQGLLIKKVQPNYPPSAIRMHVEGAVQLMATIGKTGNITSVKLLSGDPLLAQSAMDAVKQWKYKPYYLNGSPVEIQTQVTVNFKLPK